MPLVPSHGSKAGLYVNGYSWAPYLKTIHLSRTVDTADASVLRTLAKAYQPGLADGTLSCEGLLDHTSADTPPANDKQAWDNLGAATRCVVCYPTVAEALGTPMYGLSCDETDVALGAPIDGLQTLDAEFQSSVGAERLVVLAAPVSRSSTGNGTGFDLSTLDGTNGALAFGGTAYIQALVASGSSVTVKVQHSSDNSSYPDLVTFTARTTIGAERIVTALPTTSVNKWVRAQWTIASGSMTFLVGFRRNIQ